MASLPAPPHHVPVLLQETLEHLDPFPGAVLLDGTVGLGGHASAWLDATEESGEAGRVVGLDRDPEALGHAGSRLSERHEGRFSLHLSSYEDAAAALDDAGVESVDAALLDLGASSLQLDDPERGFSFRAPGPLDMRMGAGGTLGDGAETAADVVNSRPVEELARIFREYGEESGADRVAAAIEKERRRAPFRDTLRLAEVVSQSLGGRKGRRHPATRVFQALRIEVNRELERVERGLPVVARCVRDGGRMAVLTFHRLEDRLVKRFFREGKGRGAFRVLPDRTPSGGERAANPRSRSARLRAVEVIDGRGD